MLLNGRFHTKRIIRWIIRVRRVLTPLNVEKERFKFWTNDPSVYPLMLTDSEEGLSISSAKTVIAITLTNH